MPPGESEEILERFPPATEEDRAAILRFVRDTPLVYGPWKPFKALVKRAEPTQEAEILGALLGRLDAAPFPDRPSSRLTPAELRRTERVTAITASGSYVFAIEGDRNDSRLHILDMADPLQPVLVGKIDVSSAQSVALLKSGSAPGLDLDFGGLPPPVFRASLPTYAVVLTDQGIRTIDLSDPTQPRLAGSLEGTSGGYMAVSGSTVFRTHTGGWRRPGKLHLIDASDPEHLRQIGSLHINDVGNLAAAGSHVYVLVGGYGDHKIQAVDVSDPARPRLAGSLKINNPKSVVVRGSYAYLVSGEQGYYGYQNYVPGHLVVVDVSRPDALRRVASLQIGNGNAIGIAGNYVCVTLKNQGYPGSNNYRPGGAEVIDISEPTKPKIAGALQGREAGLLAMGDRHAYVGMSIYGAYWQYALRVVDLSDPARPLLLGAPPSKETFGYLKRRARRLLRGLATRDPDRFAEVAYQTLRQSGRNAAALDIAVQWVSADLLFGRGDRYVQHHHGRGGYALERPRFCLKTREERCPEAWDRRPDLVRALLTDASRPWQTHEAMLKILRAQQVEPPAFNASLLTRFLRSPSPLLITAATGQIAARIEKGTKVDPALAAETYFLSGMRLRRIVRERYVLANRSTPDGERFAARLFELATAGIQERPPSRRQAGALGLLAEVFASTVSREQMRPVLSAMLSTGRPDLERWVLEAIRLVPAAAAPNWVETLTALEPTIRARAFDALLAAVHDQAFDLDTARALVSSDSDWAREAGWRLLAGSAIPTGVIASLWDELMDSDEETPILQTALASPAALGLFRRMPLDGDKLQARLQQHPFLVRLLPPDLFEAIVRTLPAGAVVPLIAAAPDDLWARLRTACLRGLEESGHLTAFWIAAWPVLLAESDGPLRARLLGDPDFAASFLVVGDPGILDTTDPAFDGLLVRWLQGHADLFTQDSAALLTAATHTLPGIRTWGLQRVHAVGMGLPFALRLLESELPPSFAAGREFFEAAEPGSDQEMGVALALCDSPQRSVRRYGREFVERRWAGRPTPDLFRRLFENPDPHTQAFVAGLLLQAPEAAAEAAGFDRDVLRARDRGRRAKELVKKRRDREPLPDIPLLLEMARSRTPRDAEWALQQLARLALEGVQIEGFTIDGVPTV